MAIFPSAVATDSDLYIAVNALATQLTDNPLTIGATTVNVVSTTGFPTVGFISLDSEIIKYTGVTGTSFTGCTRAQDGTLAASHVQNSQVFHNIIAAHHNVLKEEIKAVEQNLSDRFGLSSSVILAPVGGLTAPSYSFAGDPNTGIWHGGADRIDMSVGGSNFFTLNTTTLDLGVRITEVNGSATAPAYTFTNATNMGMYFDGSASLYFATAGVSRWAVTGAGDLYCTSTGKVLSSDGSAANPSVSFVNATGTGLFRTGNDLNFSTNGTNRWALDSGSYPGFFRAQGSNGVHSANGSVSAPTFSFVGNENTGMFRSAANQVAIALGGVKAAEFVSAGSSNDTTYAPLRLNGVNASSNVSFGNQSTSVTTSAKQIIDLTPLGNAGLITVYGDDGAGNRFADLVFATYAATTPSVVTSKSALGSPSARTYSMAANGVVKLAMASGTYTISASAYATN